MKLIEQLKTRSRTKDDACPHVNRVTRYEIKSPDVAVHLVDCETGDHSWGLVVLEFQHFGEPLCYEFNAEYLEAVSDMLIAARAMRRPR